MGRQTLLLFLMACSLIAGASAQTQSQLDDLDRKLARGIQAQTPGWQHRRGELIQGSTNVLVQFWSFPNRVVKVSVLPSESVEEAQEKMKAFISEESEKEELKGIGDEAYAWGYELGNVAVRKGVFRIYVSTVADVRNDSDGRGLGPEERKERARSEMRRWSRDFAKHVANALDDQ